MRKATNSTPRTSKTKVAAAVDQVTDVNGKEVKPDDVRPLSFDTIKAKLASIQMPTWVRTVLAWTAGIITWGATYYCGMSSVLVLANLALALTGSGLITFLILILGYVATQILGFYSGFRVHGFITNFDGNKAADTMAAMPGKIAGWFGRVKTAAATV